LNEFSQFIQNMPFDYEGNPALGDAIAQEARDLEVYTLAHHLDSLEMEYGTLVPMRFMSRAHQMKMVSVAAWCTVHSYDESRVIGQAPRGRGQRQPRASGRLGVLVAQYLAEQGLCRQLRHLYHF
jgi:3,4-dihydroxyphenylacetate 2,3-dioxygenase